MLWVQYSVIVVVVVAVVVIGNVPLSVHLPINPFLFSNRRQPLGCDQVLGSSKVFDRCGVCDGEGTSCIGKRFTYKGFPNPMKGEKIIISTENVAYNKASDSLCSERWI